MSNDPREYLGRNPPPPPIGWGYRNLLALNSLILSNTSFQISILLETVRKKKPVAQVVCLSNFTSRGFIIIILTLSLPRSIFRTVYPSLLTNFALRILCQIKQYPLVWHHPFFSSPLLLKVYWSCKEKFHFRHSHVWKGSNSSITRAFQEELKYLFISLSLSPLSLSDWRLKWWWKSTCSQAAICWQVPITTDPT